MLGKTCAYIPRKKCTLFTLYGSRVQSVCLLQQTDFATLRSMLIHDSWSISVLRQMPAFVEPYLLNRRFEAKGTFIRKVLRCYNRFSSFLHFLRAARVYIILLHRAMLGLGKTLLLRSKCACKMLQLLPLTWLPSTQDLKCHRIFAQYIKSAKLALFGILWHFY